MTLDIWNIICYKKNVLLIKNSWCNTNYKNNQSGVWRWKVISRLRLDKKKN